MSNGEEIHLPIANYPAAQRQLLDHPSQQERNSFGGERHPRKGDYQHASAVVIGRDS
jgi:hypothetical protein